jgi:very-short-patch-repair endonuclease
MTVRDLRRVAERQMGLVTASQLHEHLSVRAARTALERGWLVRVRPHVFRLGGTPASWFQSVMAALLVAGPGAAASHATAAAIWQMPGFAASTATAIHLTVPRGRRPQLRGLRVHSTLVLLEPHIVSAGLLPTTSVERTLCDLDGTVGEQQLARLVDEMLLRRMTTVDALVAAYHRLRRGSRPSRAMGRILADRGGEWERAESRGEARLVRWLVAAGLPRPVQQHEIGGSRVDLAYPAARLFIEFDGFEVHTTREHFERDRRRDNALRLVEGATVLRYTWRSTREEVVREVAAALGQAGVVAALRGAG